MDRPFTKLVPQQMLKINWTIKKKKLANFSVRQASKIMISGLSSAGILLVPDTKYSAPMIMSRPNQHRVKHTQMHLESEQVSKGHCLPETLVYRIGLPFLW